MTDFQWTILVNGVCTVVYNATVASIAYSIRLLGSRRLFQRVFLTLVMTPEHEQDVQVPLGSEIPILSM
jgi:hypothetical protein